MIKNNFIKTSTGGLQDVSEYFLFISDLVS